MDCAYNKQLTFNTSCERKAVNRTLQLVSFGVTTLRRITKAKVIIGNFSIYIQFKMIKQHIFILYQIRIQAFYKINAAYRPFLVDFTIDYCEYLTANWSSSILYNAINENRTAEFWENLDQSKLSCPIEVS